MAELERVLVAKLGLDPKRAEALVAELGAIVDERVPTPSAAPAVTGHGPDDEILAASVAARAAVLVTYDRRHLLPLERHQGVRILTPQALLSELVR